MPSNLEMRKQRWYAVLVIPKDARARLGKFKFIQSLGTGEKRKAQTLAAPLLAKWRAIIRRERGEGDALMLEALRWRETLAAIPADDHLREALEHQLTDKAEKLEESLGETAAVRFARVALGSATLSSEHFDAWVAQLSLAPKTIDQMKKDTRRLVDRFATLQDITPKAVKQWVDDMRAKSTSFSSTRRMIGAWRSYWKYLASIEAVPSEAKPPFPSVEAKKEERSRKYLGYTTGDVVRLWGAANATRGTRGAPDPVMADLILLGAYTGARIEELCSMKLADVGAASFSIKDSKTEAGVREVPIHSALRPLVTRRRKVATDEYLLPGLPFNKYEDRSNAIGKRFGRLKESLGFHGRRYGFHSFRATVVTLLENAGISENLAADIVGHDKPRMTYGLYSGGATLAVKAEALEKVRYPFPAPGVRRKRR